MKRIRWIGTALVAAAASVAVIIGAWPAGAYVWSQRTQAKRLTGAQKSGLAAVITCAAPGIPAAALKDWRCEQAEDAWTCTGAGSVTMTEDAFVQALVAGAVDSYESRAGGNVTVPMRLRDITITGACLAQMSAWIGAVWAGHSTVSVQRYYVARNPVIAGAVDGEATVLVTGDAAGYLDAGGGRVGGPVVVGVVE